MVGSLIRSPPAAAASPGHGASLRGLAKISLQLALWFLPSRSRLELPTRSKFTACQYKQ